MNYKLLLIFLLIIVCNGINTNNRSLKQVLILSRHNVRYPFGLEMQNHTPKTWPAQIGQPGYLTPKGALLEGIMGEYFAEWFKSEQFLPEDCPGDDIVYVFANSVNRTIASAKAFVESAFKDCQITVHHKEPSNGTLTNGEEHDPLFEPVIHNTTEAFKTMVIDEINKKINNNYILKTALVGLNKIMDIKHSETCRSRSICDFSDFSKNEIYFEVGREVWVNGPLFIANNVIDNFIMNYYEGWPMEDIAFGLLQTPEKWEALTEIGRQDHNIRYTTLAKDIAAPLMKNLTETFLKYDEKPKLILIMGHDYNQNPIFNLMGFKPIRLPNHYELYPIGGKMVFQRWTENGNDFLKVEYVYPSWSQVRNATKLSLADPPQRVLLEPKWCNVDANGFCPWNEFVNKLML